MVSQGSISLRLTFYVAPVRPGASSAVSALVIVSDIHSGKEGWGCVGHREERGGARKYLKIGDIRNRGMQEAVCYLEKWKNTVRRVFDIIII